MRAPWAYEWTTLTVEGLGSSTSRSRFGSISTLVAGVIGGPIIDSDRWRLGISMTTPVAWQPGTINALFTRNGPNGENRFNYISEVSFTTLLPAVSAGYRVRPGLRVGAGAWFSWTSLTQNQSAVARSASVDSAVTTFRRFDSDGSVLAAALALGVQLDFARAWVAGLTLTTPSGRLWGESELSFDGAVTRPSVNGDVFFRDEKARFDYKQPLRIAFGVARTLRTWRRGVRPSLPRLDGPLRDVLERRGSDVATSPPRPAAPPVYENVRYEDTVYEARQVWNSAIGGHYDLTKRWTVHAGFFTDISPVANAQEAILRKVTLLGGTGGPVAARRSSVRFVRCRLVGRRLGRSRGGDR
jgi:hypothetical protein